MRTAIRLAAALLLAAAGQAGAGEWTFAGLHLAGFDGFTEETAQYPRQLHHPDGTQVLVSVFRAPREPEAGVRQVYERFAEENEPAIALESERLDDGSTLLSGAIRKTGLPQSAFLLMYMVIAPAERVAFVTVEGAGDPQAAYKRYRAIFDTARWEQ
jgi:hypothetical protein